MKALSMIEPWASLVAWGYKRIETRSWRTPFRGMIAIHASRSTEVVQNSIDVRGLFEAAGTERPAGWPLAAEEYPLGKVVAVVRLVDCRPMDMALIHAQTRMEREFGAWAQGRFAWMLSEVRRLPDPIPCRGSLGLWNLPADVEAGALARQSIEQARKALAKGE